MSYRGFRFPPDVIQRAIWLYLRFSLSLRDVEDILAERGIDVTYETIRCWVHRFGPQISAKIRAGRPRPTSKWHLDEMFVSVSGRQMYLWRAIDDEGEVLEVLVTARRDKRAAIRFLRKLLKKYQLAPITIVTDRCRSYRAGIEELKLCADHVMDKKANNRIDFACSSSRPRAKTSGLQICSLSSEVPIHVCSHIQPLQRRSSSHNRSDTPPVSVGGSRQLAFRMRGECIRCQMRLAARRLQPT